MILEDAESACVLVALEVTRQSVRFSWTFVFQGWGVPELGEAWGEQRLLLCPATNVCGRLFCWLRA